MTDWAVELEGDNDDLQDWMNFLNPDFDPHVVIRPSDKTSAPAYLLRSVDFRGMTSPDEVREAGVPLVLALSGLMNAFHGTGPVSVNSVITLGPQGEIFRARYMTGEAGKYRVRVSAVGLAIGPTGQPLPPPAPMPSSAQRALCEASGDALAAYRYFGQADNWYDLVKAYEALGDSSGSRGDDTYMRLGATTDEITRFGYTADQHRKYQRANSKANAVKPALMSLAEGQSFIRKLVKGRAEFNGGTSGLPDKALGQCPPDAEWAVELAGHKFDLANWQDHLVSEFDPHVSMFRYDDPPEDVYVLRSNSFAVAASADEVRDKAALLVSALNGLIRAFHKTGPVSLKAVVKILPSGQLHRTQYVEMELFTNRNRFFPATVSVGSVDGPLSPPRSEPSPVQRAYTRASQDALEAARHLARGDNWYDLFKAYEAIALALGLENDGAAELGASSAERKRFSNTRRQYRHHVAKTGSKARLLSLQEGQEFIRQLIRAMFR